MLFINMSCDQVARHLSAMDNEPIYEDTLLEILRYLGGAPEANQFQSTDAAVAALHEGLARLRQGPGSGV
jgi:hypothetical protein